MSLSKRTLEYQDDEFEGRIVLGRANVSRGYLRSRLTDEGLRAPEKPGDDPLLRIARWTQYPAIRAGARSGTLSFFDVKENEDGDQVRNLKRRVDAEEMTFEDYQEIPEFFMIACLDAVFELNPHWLLALQDDPDPESEAGKS